MAYYVKVRKQTADTLQLTQFRNMTADGSVLLWQADTQLTGIRSLVDATAALGGVMMTATEARAEIDGRQNAPLPAPTDARYFVAGEMTPEEEGNPVEEDEVVFEDDAVEGLDA